MSSFPLKIVTPDGLIFDGRAEKLILRTLTGDMAVLARHADCVCPLGMGRAIVETDGKRRTAACIGGLLRVANGEATLVPTTFEWADQIDAERAEKSLRQAEAVLNRKDAADTELRLAEARRKRALVRVSAVKERDR